MRDGLLYVLSEPGAVPGPEFHDWYDNEHAPARMAFDQVRAGWRYVASDGRRPSWLAVYTLDLALLDTPAYRSLRSDRSDRERDVMSRLDTLDRRVYERLPHPATDPGRDPAAGAPLLIAVAMTSTDDAALDDWYEREHIPALSQVPGWRHTTRYRLVTGDAPTLLALHAVDGPEAFDTPEYRRATNTPWRSRVMATVTHRDRRLFTPHRRL
ncbi:hypothetical protein [Pseudonocardia acaciae]|uniref:hypothetical protein n=1 Tax=Pseudonocardia acaciae TaxID=551276 RepID=UPI0004919ECA|nr:hypothetical protein [Pseudonocardia acaciae]